MKFLIKNGWVVNPATNLNKKCDVLIEDGKILSISDKIINCEELDSIDAEGKIVIPGIVDMHVHLREPGFEFKEDMETGTLSAVAGGITTVACMPNTKPTIDSGEMVLKLNEIIKDKSIITVKIISAITKRLEGEELADLENCALLGVVGFSDDGRTTMDDKYMEDAFKISSRYKIPVITHCENHELAKLYLDEPTPPEVEYSIVKRDIDLARKLNGRLHIAHVSTIESVEYIRLAKTEGLNISCEVAPHHFSISSEEVDITNPYSKVNPPIRNREHVKSIINGIIDGTIDVIVTDHAPHEKESKETSYRNASFGISGFETSFSLSYSSLVKTGYITLNKLVKMMTSEPAKIIGVDKGSLEEGKDADLSIIDLNEEYVINSNNFLSKGKNTPFNGKKVFGKVKMTIVNGKILFSEGF